MNLNWNQVNAVGRHVATYAAGTITGAVTLGLLTGAQGTGLEDGVQHITNGVTELAKGVAAIAAVVVPIYTAWRSGRSASPQAQGQALVAAANNTSNPQEAAIANTAIAQAVIASNDLKLNGTIVAPPAVAAAIPSEKVVPK